MRPAHPARDASSLGGFRQHRTLPPLGSALVLAYSADAEHQWVDGEPEGECDEATRSPLALLATSAGALMSARTRQRPPRDRGL